MFEIVAVPFGVIEEVGCDGDDIVIGVNLLIMRQAVEDIATTDKYRIFVEI